jgi:hypothetical protein
MYLYTDVDDVLFQYFRAFKIFASEQFGCTFKSEEPIQWDLTHWIDGPWKEAIRAFNVSDKFGQLEPFPDAVEAISELKQHFKIVAISACEEESRDLRIKNLKDVFGDAISDVHLVGLGQSKFKILSDMPKGIWVEDRMEGALDGMVIGHDTYLMNRSHNMYQSHPEVKKVDSWKQLLEIIRSSDVVNFNSSF